MAGRKIKLPKCLDEISKGGFKAGELTMFMGKSNGKAIITAEQNPEIIHEGIMDETHFKERLKKLEDMPVLSIKKTKYTGNEPKKIKVKKVYK